MSKRSRERSAASEFIDAEFEKALEETEYRQKSRGRHIEHKTLQLCRRVQRALNLALAGQFVCDALDDVFVIGVSAEMGCGHLVVHVALQEDRSVDVVLRELHDHSPQLRAIVAGYISRKRAPELSFVVTPLGGDAYE